MTKGETKMLETDEIIFPINFSDNQPESNQIKQPTEAAAIEKQSLKADFKQRFVRLKKSLRKRSASIL